MCHALTQHEVITFLISLLFLTGAALSLLESLCSQARRPAQAGCALAGSSCHSPLFLYRFSGPAAARCSAGIWLDLSLTVVCLCLQRYKVARHRATAACPEAPLHSQGSSSQLLDDQEQPPATTEDSSKKMNANHGLDKEGTELSALQEQALRSPEGKGKLATSVAESKSLASMTDVCEIMVVEESLQESKSTATCPLPEESSAAGELLGHAVYEEEEANAARQGEGTEHCQDPGSGGGLGQKEASNVSQEAAAEPSSLAKSETASLTSAGCRRSSRRKPR